MLSPTSSQPLGRERPRSPQATRAGSGTFSTRTSGGPRTPAKQFDRASYLESNTGGRTTWRQQDLGEPEVLAVAGTAVLRTVVTDTIETVTGPETFRMPLTQVWVLDDLGWQCLAGHAGPRLGG